MTDKELLISHCTDKINYSVDNSIITKTDFLSTDERSDVEFLTKKFSKDVDMFWFGGYDDAERTVAVIIPACYCFTGTYKDFLDAYPESNPIALIRISKDKFSQISHRDYLGAIMGLGIKRKLIGDILVFEWGAYVFVADSIADYIVDNLNQCGRASVKCEVVNIDKLDLPEDKVEIVFHSVASMRLDNILSAGFGLSRNNCNNVIASGVVFVNSVRADKKDMLIKENDKIVLRGKGKIVIDSIIGKNKRDRIHINIRHYK